LYGAFLEYITVGFEVKPACDTPILGMAESRPSGTGGLRNSTVTQAVTKASAGRAAAAVTQRRLVALVGPCG
jgi:hypothetical protein